MAGISLVGHSGFVYARPSHCPEEDADGATFQDVPDDGHTDWADAEPVSNSGFDAPDDHHLDPVSYGQPEEGE
jgi:hypothetical protein